MPRYMAREEEGCIEKEVIAGEMVGRLASPRGI